MKTIKYEINGTFVEIEVSDEFARQYEQIEADEKCVNRKETRRHQSLETLIESGFQIVDQESDIEEKAFQNDDIEQLYKAFAVLTEEQKWLIQQVFYYDRKQSEIAAELGIDPTAIRNRLRKIYDKIKKIFQ
jgi:RNA polymerase sigma factor (sigma-70 family)